MFVWPMFGVNTETEQGSTVKLWLNDRLDTYSRSKL